MKLLDYWRLSGVHIRAHKKQTLTTVIVVGALFGVLMAGSILIRGVEDVSLEKVLQPTGGKVLIQSAARDTFCEDNCNAEADRAEIENVVAQHGGSEVAVGMLEGSPSALYVVAYDVLEHGLEVNLDQAPSASIPILADASTIANWLLISTPNEHADGEERARVVTEIRERSLGKVIHTVSNDYYVVGILPGGFGLSSLSLSALNRSINPLNLLLSAVPTSNSKALIVRDGRMEMQPTAEVWALFETVEVAHGYVDDLKSRECNHLEVSFGKCDRVRQFVASSVIGNPIEIYDNFEQIWRVFRLAAIILMSIGMVIALLTYTRLIAWDQKIIMLYNTMGAKRHQVMWLYLMYLLRLAFLTSIFSLLLGMGLALAVNILNMGALTQIFALGFGSENQAIWLLGWNDWIWVLLGSIFLVAPVCILLNFGKFRIKRR